jgi:transcriptional regulator with XRE-family HTH domain
LLPCQVFFVAFIEIFINLVYCFHGGIKMFPERLAELRKIRGYTHNDLARVLQVTRQTYSLYESGKHEMSYDSLIKIADFFGVTVDYLFGRCDYLSTDLLSSDEIDIVMKLRTFSKRDRQLTKAIIDTITNT